MEKSRLDHEQATRRWVAGGIGTIALLAVLGGGGEGTRADHELRVVVCDISGDDQGEMIVIREADMDKGVQDGLYSVNLQDCE